MMLQAFTNLLIRLFVSLILLFFINTYSYCKSIDWNDYMDRLSIGDKVDVLEDASGSISYA
ncbi:MAG: hypothetical protein MI866_05990, partial [Bacteroidales bacterium]|nr:hypothetical protein [Bacteroidales bacterium]